ncbi:5'-nucleotidase C-terminal domain-containing protein [Paracoccus suum]|uniref:5'-nucleotidase C-terminal domain-containing protein n=1 Tax=Paracoccus suum TaxID=2259340 RepID=UPI0013B05793|nr:5'-nucleotidase C-terminal domain-containing protein [Paracoccus suum]
MIEPRSDISGDGSRVGLREDATGFAEGHASKARAGRTGDATAIDLRIMAITDLHMQLLDFDYFRRRTDLPLGRGLEHLAVLIERQRSTAANTLLFDNGDLLQGNPLADDLARAATGAGAHPAIASLNAVGCDAATLGNHDFSYGRSFLARALGGAAFPFVLANARLPGLQNRVRPWVILQRELRDRAGRTHQIGIGVIGFVPPQSSAWEAAEFPGLRTEDIIEAAEREVPLMRASGADLVVALAHSGTSPLPHQLGTENAASALAGLPGIDAVIAGHSHELNPAPEERREYPQPSPAPLVQAGFGGSHLGVINLVLEQETNGRRWQVGHATAELHPATSLATDIGSPARVAIRKATLPAHRSALRAGARRIGRTAVPLGSHLAMLGQDPGLRLVAMAQRWHLRAALSGTHYAELPILVAVAPFRAGARGGPGHYTHIPAGRITHGDLADLYAFNNRAAALIVTGAELADWLERAAGAFLRILPGAGTQELIDPDFASYNFDMIDGLHWQIDPSRPARYMADGLPRADGTGGRIRNLTYGGQPVTPERRFLLATNSYRLSGVGLYADLTADCAPISAGTATVRDLVRAYLRRRRVVAPQARPMFTFARVPGASGLIRTGPEVATMLADNPLGLIPEGTDDQGFLRLRVPLDRD